MSLPLTVKAPVRSLSVGVNEPWKTSGPTLHRVELVDPASAFRLASRDVIDEVRHRMARQGFHWE
jgi:hypothetical protein